jgi:hypothetical protein
MNFKTKNEIIKAFQYAEMASKFIATNDIKKGDFIQETNGWYGECIDNLKGNTRCCNMHGYFEEAGSIYVWDIDRVCKDGKIYWIKLTPKQEKDKQRTEDMMDI